MCLGSQTPPRSMIHPPRFGRMVCRKIAVRSDSRLYVIDVFPESRLAKKGLDGWLHSRHGGTEVPHAVRRQSQIRWALGFVNRQHLSHSLELDDDWRPSDAISPAIVSDPAPLVDLILLLPLPLWGASVPPCNSVVQTSRPASSGRAWIGVRTAYGKPSGQTRSKTRIPTGKTLFIP